MSDSGLEPKTSENIGWPGAHGGGWLTPGNPGNKGGGVPTKRLRELCREGFSRGVGKVSKIAEGIVEGDSIRALDVLGKYGLGEQKVMVPEEILQAISQIGPKYMDEAKYEAFAAELVEALKDTA